LHLLRGGIRAEREPELPYRLWDRHIAVPTIAAREWVSTQKQQVEDKDCETKRIVIWCPRYTGERSTLKFRRSEMVHADFTQKELTAARNLKRVTINQSDSGVICDGNILLIQISDNVPVSVDVADGGCEISCDVHQETPIGPRKVLFALRWVV
jgi:hypothetical protein